MLSLGAATSLLIIPAFAVLGTMRDRGGPAASRHAAGTAIRLLDREPDLAGQLAVAAYRIEPTPPAAQALVEASVRQIAASAGAIRGLRVTSDGRYLIVVGDAGGSVWDIADPARVHRVGDLAGAPPATTVDRRQLAAGSGNRSVGAARRGFSATEFSPDDADSAAGGTAAGGAVGSALRAVTTVSGPSASAAAPAPQTVVTAGADGVLRLWQLIPPRLVDDGELDQVRTAAADVTPLMGLRGHVGAVTAVAASADGRTLASAGADRTVRLWDVRRPRTPRALAVLALPAEVTSVAFTPDGRSLVLGGPGHLAVWDVADPRNPRSRAERTAAANVRAIAVSPDSRWFAATTTTARGVQTEIFGLGDPRGLRRLTSIAPGPAPAVAPDPAGALALSADGRVLAVGGAAGQITLWDMSSPVRPVRRGVLPVGANPGTTTTLGLAGPAGTLAAATGDSVRLWQLDLLAAQDEVCARVGDRISREQWRSYLGHRRYNPPCD
ncbi:WD40 repeat domain-containing protein [Frankia tisae]|uniref:WD40 repeat domain-containing protein n=1 Tax=Frankia tisae TaxID=2950104 RepID=UPI0021C08D94|nr:hypothetical protein [Frankia tisae]